MSTRACYTFKDETGEFHVYKHHDGYPTGAASFLVGTAAKAWPLPRFEADEFAAAFVAVNKKSGGDVRLMQSGDIRKIAPGDIEWHYTVEPMPSAGKTSLNRIFDGPRELLVTVRSPGDWRKVWSGPLSQMTAWAQTAKAA